MAKNEWDVVSVTDSDPWSVVSVDDARTTVDDSPPKTGMRRDGVFDPRLLGVEDKPRSVLEGKRVGPSSNGPLLNPDYIDSVRDSFASIPDKDRMAALRQVAEYDKTVRGRAAKALLEQAEYNNAKITPEAKQEALELNKAPKLTPTGGKKQKPKEVSFLDSTPGLLQSIDGVTAQEVVNANETAMGLGDARDQARRQTNDLRRDRTVDEALGDFGTNFKQSLNMVQSIVSNNIDPSSEWSARLAKEAQQLHGELSPQRRYQIDQVAARIAGSETELGKFGVMLGELVTNPMTTVEELIKQGPLMAAMIATSFAGGAGGALAVRGAGAILPKVALADAISGGAVSSAAAAAGSMGASRVAGGLAAGGDAAQQVYSHLTDEKNRSMMLKNPDVSALIAEGKSEDDAIKTVALTKSRLAQGMAGAVGFALGGVGLEKVIANQIGKRSAGETAKSAFIKEIGGELADEVVGTQGASNIAIGQIDPDRKLTEGFGETAAVTLMTTAPMAGAAALGAYRSNNPAPTQDPVVDFVNRNAGLRVPETTLGMAALAEERAKLEQLRAATAKTPEQVAAALTSPEIKTVGEAIAAANAEVQQAGASAAATAAINQIDTDVATLTQKTPAAPIPGLADPLAQGSPAPITEPVRTWTGRKGGGYDTADDAATGLARVSKDDPSLDWKVEQMPDGRFRVAGYAPKTGGNGNVTGENGNLPPVMPARVTPTPDNAALMDFVSGQINETTQTDPRLTPLSKRPTVSYTVRLGGQNATTGQAGNTTGTGTEVPVRMDVATGVSAALAESRRSLGVAAEKAKLRGESTSDYPVLNEPSPKDAAPVIALGQLLGGKFGGTPVVPYSDTRKGASNGFELRGVAHVNVGRTSTNVASTTLHEFHHSVQRIAEADLARGEKDTPAIRYVNSVDSLFDTISEEGRRNYVSNFLHSSDLKSVYQQALKSGMSEADAAAGREAKLAEFMKSPELRKEMMADFMGNRATDKEFLGDLAKADPTGFKAFVTKWIQIIDGLVAKLRGNGRNIETANVDKYLADLTKAKEVAKSALIEYSRSTSAIKADESSNLRYSQGVEAPAGVIAEVAPNPDQPVANDWREMTYDERAQTTRAVANKTLSRIFSELGLKGWSFRVSTGTFEHETNPNVIIDAPKDSTHEEIDEVAKVVGFVLDQKAMVTFDEGDTNPETANGFVKVVIPAGMSTEQVNSLRNWIADHAPQVDGDTLRDGALIFGNFTHFGDNPLSDDEYRAGIRQAVESFDFDGDIEVLNPVRHYSGYIQPESRDGYLEGTRYGEGDRQGLEARGDDLRGRQGRGDVERLRQIGQEAIALRDRWIAARASARRGPVATEGASRPEREYGTPRDRAVSAVGVHFSQQRRPALSSTYFGTGHKGSEQARLADAKDIAPRIYFYVDNGNGVHPEAGVGGVRHTVKLNNLYSTKLDPLGLVKGMKSTQEGFNDFERSVVKSGFDGYLADNLGGQQDFAVLLGKHEIEMPRYSVTQDGNWQMDEIDDLTDEPVSFRDQSKRLGSYEKTDYFANGELITGPGLPAFMRDNKLVDDNGNPLVWYHGTARDVVSFTPKQADAVFLSPKPEFAESFADSSQEWMALNYRDVLTSEQVEQARDRSIKKIMADKTIPKTRRKELAEQIAWGFPRGEAQDAFMEEIRREMPTGPNIMPLIARATNPFDYRNEQHVIDLIYTLKDRQGRDFVEVTPVGQETFEVSDDDLEMAISSGIWNYIEAPEVQDVIRNELGHDAFYVKEGGVKNLAVYDNRAVKSLIGNNGQYSLEDARINFSKNQDARPEDEVPSRYPTAVKFSGDRANGEMYSTLDAAREDPVYFAKIAPLIGSHTGITGASNEETIELNVEFFKRNILWLYDHAMDVSRQAFEMATHWYVGGNKIAREWAKEWGVEPRTVAGMMAVTSPSMEWFVNLQVTKRIGEFLTQKPFSWTPEMQAEMLSQRSDPKAKRGFLKALENINGKPYFDLSDPYEKAVWYDIYDRAHNDNTYHEVTPDGTFLGLAMTKGKNSRPAKGLRQSVQNIQKAISIFEDQSKENLSAMLGNGLKVRNFYNNLANPWSAKPYITIDTHAVGAAHLLGLSNQSDEANSNFKGPKSNKIGLSGTYVIYHEAYTRAAAERSIMGREMQSITWEAGRTMFEKKRSNSVRLREVWDSFKRGEINEQQAREQVQSITGGVAEPDWFRRYDSLPEKDRGTGDFGKLGGARASRDGVRGTQPGGPSGRAGVPASLRLSKTQDATDQYLSQRNRGLTTVTPQSTLNADIDLAVRSLESAVEEIKSGNYRQVSVPIGPVPHTLRMLGHPTQMLKADASIIKKVLIDKHSDDFKDISPREFVMGIYRPALVLKGERAGEFELVTPLTTEDGPVMVSVKADTQNKPDAPKVTAIMSAYAKPVVGKGNTIGSRILAGRMIYADMLTAPVAISGNSEALTKGSTTGGLNSAILPQGPASLKSVPQGSTDGKPLNKNFTGWKTFSTKILSDIANKKIKTDVDLVGWIGKHYKGDAKDAPAFSKPQDVGPIGFYSALHRSVDKLPYSALPAAGWKDAIKSLLNKGQIKSDEVEWTGINEWIGLQSGKVSKQQVLDYLQQNGVQVEEKVLGGGGSWVVEWDNGDRQQFGSEQEAREALDAEVRLQQEMADQAEIEFDPNLVGSVTRATSEDGGTKYGQYTLPGGENYREVLLTLPKQSYKYVGLDSLVQPSGDNRKQAFEDAMTQKYGGETFSSVYGKLSGSEVDRYEQIIREARQSESNERNRVASQMARSHPLNNHPSYKSAHWDQPNVLAHLRVNDRTDANGDRVLFVEEIQSDWGQEAKKDGFKQDPSVIQQLKANLAKAEQAKRDAETRVGVVEDLLTKPLFLKGSKEDQKRILDRLSEARDAYFGTAVPNAMAARAALQDAEAKQSRAVPKAPFVDKTDKWLNLALKRIITMAVDEGYDKIAFVNGEQSAERYDLSKQVSEIKYNVTGDSNYHLTVVSKDGRRVPVPSSLDAEGVEDHVGKEIAQKIIDTATSENQMLRGLDLRVGGTGMIKFYNEIVPNAVKALAKKLGGEVGLSVIGEPYSPEDVNQFLGGWKSSSQSLDAIVDNGVIAARKHDQVINAVVESIPVDVVNVLSSNGIDTEEFARNPKVYFDQLPPDSRLAVSNGLARSLSLVGARIRAGLRSAYEARLDKEILPALKASHLTFDEAIRILRFPPFNQTTGVGGAASIGAGSGAVDGSLALAFGGREGGAAALADFVRWFQGISPHRVGDGGILLQTSLTITPAMREKVEDGLPLFSRAQHRQGINYMLPGETRLSKTRRILQDYFLPVLEVQNALLSQGGTVTEASDVYRAEERMYGRIEEALRDFRKRWFDPMIQKTLERGLTMDEVSLYAYAKHAKERNDHIATIRDDMPDNGSGMTTQEADAILKQFEAEGKTSDLEDIHGDLMAITAATRRVMLDEGLITQGQYDAWENQYESYVPLRGFENADPDGEPVPFRNGGRGFNIRGKETMRALGRRTRATDIIENIALDYERAVDRGERNQVAKSFLEMIRTNPDPSLWEINKRLTKESFDRYQGKVVKRTQIDAGADTIAVKIDGKEVYITIKDRRLLNAMRRASKSETGQLEAFINQTSGRFLSLIRKSLTQYNPVFSAVNAVRDFQTGSVGVLDTLGMKGVGLYAKHYRAAVAAAGRHQSGSLGKSGMFFGDPVMDRYFEEFRAAGGTTGGFYGKSAEDMNREIRNILLASGAKPKGLSENIRTLGGSKTGRTIMRGVQSAGNVLEFTGAVSENAARVAAYRAARELGKTPAEAASIAKNLTTNFNRKGEWGAVLNGLFLFYNASVQGAHRAAVSMRNPKVLGLTAGLAALGATTALLALSMGGDDDDDGQAYWDKIPQFEKERNLIIMLPPGYEMDGVDKVGTNGRYIKIPMPYVYNIFPNFGMTMVDVIRNQKDKMQGVSVAKGAVNMLNSVMGSLNPLGGSVDLNSGASILQAVFPTVADIAVQQVMGVDSFSRPTAPYKGEFDLDPDSENVNARQAGGAWHMIARGLNRISGGDQYEPGLIDVTPGTLENAAKQLTGGTGTFLSDLFVNLPTKLYGVYVANNEADITYRDYPFLRNFYGEVDGVTDSFLMYERRRDVMKAKEVQNNRRDAGVDQKDDPKEDALASLGKMSAKYTKEMSALKKEEISLAEDAEMTTLEKNIRRKEIKARRSEIAREYNRIFMDRMRDAASQ